MAIAIYLGQWRLQEFVQVKASDKDMQYVVVARMWTDCGQEFDPDEGHISRFSIYYFNSRTLAERFSRSEQTTGPFSGHCWWEWEVMEMGAFLKE